MKSEDIKLKKYNKPKLKVYGDIKENTKAATGQGRADAIYSGQPY
jgi:hypothetical protein